MPLFVEKIVSISTNFTNSLKRRTWQVVSTAKKSLSTKRIYKSIHQAFDLSHFPSCYMVTPCSMTKYQFKLYKSKVCFPVSKAQKIHFLKAYPLSTPHLVARRTPLRFQIAGLSLPSSVWIYKDVSILSTASSTTQVSIS